MSGKPTLTRQMLRNHAVLFDLTPIRIVHVYSVWQKNFEKSHNNKIKYIRDVDKILEDDIFFN